MKVGCLDWFATVTVCNKIIVISRFVIFTQVNVEPRCRDAASLYLLDQVVDEFVSPVFVQINRDPGAIWRWVGAEIIRNLITLACSCLEIGIRCSNMESIALVLGWSRSSRDHSSSKSQDGSRFEQGETDHWRFWIDWLFRCLFDEFENGWVSVLLYIQLLLVRKPAWA